MTRSKRVLSESSEIYQEMAELMATEPFKNLLKDLTQQQMDFALLVATSGQSLGECAKQSGYSKLNQDRAGKRLLDNSFVMDAINFFRTEMIIKRGCSAIEHRRFLIETRNTNRSDNPKVALQAEKILLEMEGHIGSAKQQRSGNININISGLIPASGVTIDGEIVDK